jgi:NTP pyrophosphatase (non-canonical NTP hydrolase)
MASEWTATERDVAESLSSLAEDVHAANRKWWVDLETGQWKDRNVGEMLMLIVSEIAEAMEGHRKGLMDDKLPHRPMIEVELADALIRIFDVSAGLGLDIGAAFVDKMKYNEHRADHKPEARKAVGGKKY